MIMHFLRKIQAFLRDRRVNVMNLNLIENFMVEIEKKNLSMIRLEPITLIYQALFERAGCILIKNTDFFFVVS